MARLEERDYTYFTTVRGMCRSCREVVPARVFFRDDAVWQEPLCPACRNEPAMIAEDKDWYMERVLVPFDDRSPVQGAGLPTRGCPYDCGPCTWHASPCQLPVVSVTNVCNMKCPICFTYNRPESPWHMGVDEMRRIVASIREHCGVVDLINVTGGEPTLHPDIVDILAACRDPAIGRVTMNSNGLRLAEDDSLCRELADLDVHVILSFHTFDPDESVLIHGRDVVGAKLAAIENLTGAGVKMTLLNVMIRGVNEPAAGQILDLMRQNDLILSLTVQTMTYTGQGGGRFARSRHVPVDEAARIVCEHSGGALAPSDFVSRPSAHPLCYQTCYMLKSGGSFVPFARFASPGRIADLMRDSYLVRLGDDERLFRDAVDELYARGEAEHLAVIRRLVDEMYPKGRALDDLERQRVSESAVRTVYIHSHMDEDNFDCSRAMMCPDLVTVAPGRMIPACTYNLFYRMADRRFYVRP